jgi:homogentisate 1,2-dioxygenase
MVGGAGEPATKNGLGIYIYACGKSMGKQAFYNADGDFLIVPERGTLDIQTELGHLLVRSNEIAVIPRGIRFRVMLPDGSSRGYILEIYTNHFELPELGPIGSNGLANARDFQAPVASFEDDTSEWDIIAKFDRQLHLAKQAHSPFDVVAWHGV